MSIQQAELPPPACERISYEHICKELAGHTIKRVAGVLGSYEGRWLCKNNASGHSWFEITAWSGYVVMSGDRGEWVFSRRNTNMIGFFVDCGASVDLDYVHEKLQAADVRHDVSEFSERKWREVLEDELIECPNNYDGEEEKERSENIQQLLDYPTPETLDEAYELLRDDLDWVDDLPRLTEYTDHFVWAVRAIAWFSNNVPVETELASHQAVVDAACIRVANAETYYQAGCLAARSVPVEKLIDFQRYAIGYSMTLEERIEQLDSKRASEVAQ